MRCQAIKKTTNTQCRINARDDTEFCFTHTSSMVYTPVVKPIVHPVITPVFLPDIASPIIIPPSHTSGVVVPKSKLILETKVANIEFTKKSIDAQDAFEGWDFSKKNYMDCDVSYGYLAIISALYNKYQPETFIHLQNIRLLHSQLKKFHATESREVALVKLYDLVDDFIQLDAHMEMLDLWKRLNPILNNYFGPLFTYPITAEAKHKNSEINLIFHVGQKIKDDYMFGVIYEIWRYQFGILKMYEKPLVPSFEELSEDILEIQSIITNEKSQPFISKWKMITNGIIKRIWFSDTVEDTIKGNNLEKIRSMLRFFPTPYQRGANKMLYLLIPREECKEWIVKKTLNPNDHTIDNKKICGSNCLGSTILSMMLANEVGLLGNTIHVVRRPGHIFLATGNRETQWKDRSVGVIETTSRHRLANRDVCEKPLMSLIEANAYKKGDDYLVPNFYEYYIWVVMRVERHYAYKMSEGEKAVPFLQKILVYRSTNIFGVNEVILHQLVFYGKYDELKNDIRVYNRLLELVDIAITDTTSTANIKDHFSVEINFVIYMLLSFAKIQKYNTDDLKSKLKILIEKIQKETGKVPILSQATLKYESLVS